ncbi:MAG: acetylxylan esterase [bacterium]
MKLVTISLTAFLFILGGGLLVEEAVAVAPYTGQPYPSQFENGRNQDMIFYAEGQSDFLFRKQKEVVLYCQPVRRGLILDWGLCRNLVSSPLSTGSCHVAADNSFRITLPTKALQPGFYDLRVRMPLSATQTIEGVTTFGWQVEKQSVVLLRPDDFDEFWQSTRASLTNFGLDLHCELPRMVKGSEIDRDNVERSNRPAHNDPEGERFQEVELYKVDFATAGQQRVYAWFAKPAGKGPFPGLLILPGAGDRYIPAPLEPARHGYATLAIHIHGEPVDLENSHYLGRSTESKSLYLNAMQAMNALVALPGVDTKRIAVSGGSQGGRLSVVVAALDPRVKAAIPIITHYAYLPYARWAQSMNAKHSDGRTGITKDFVEGDKTPRVDSYFDVLNFAAKVSCPVLMCAGLTDTVSSPTSVYAVYQTVKGPKEVITCPNIGHAWSPAFDRYAWSWLAKVMEQK